MDNIIKNKLLKNKLVSYLTIKETGHVLLVFQNPPVNALSLSFVEELNECIEESIKNKATALVLQGEGKGFCAGADLKERSGMSDEETINTVNKYKKLFEKIENLSCPTLAILHGFVLGGGLELALSCDFRFSKKDCIIGFPETSIGIIPGAGGTQRLTRLIGPSKAKKWIFTAQKFSAQEALQDNVIDRIIDIEEDGKIKNDVHNKFITTIVCNSTIAISSAKRAIDAFDGSDSGYDVEREEYLKTLSSDARKKTLKRYKK